jgi:hypothetical protein
MAFVVPTKKGNFEVRESRSTPEGPRSRTLATFKELDGAATKKAQEKATKPLSADALRKAALRAGAPVARTPIDGAARELLGLIAKGARPDPMLKRLLLDALVHEDRRDRSVDSEAVVSDAARAAAEWIDASPRQRGDTLKDLLLLADALPVRLRSDEIGFPRLRSV